MEWRKGVLDLAKTGLPRAYRYAMESRRVSSLDHTGLSWIQSKQVVDRNRPTMTSS